jgi:hypothetical protein
MIDAIDHQIFYFDGKIADADALGKIRKMYTKIKKKTWSVSIEAPILGVEQIIEYLGRYIKRIAITNGRLVNIDQNSVTFEYKKYVDQKSGEPAPKGTIELKGWQFLQRFCQHILPRYLQRVHYYGLYAWSKQVDKSLAYVAILGMPQATYQPPLTRQLFQKTLGTDPDVCPDCACYQTFILLPLTVDATQYFRLRAVWVHSSVKLKPPSPNPQTLVA